MTSQRPPMKLEEILASKKSEIIARWLDVIVNSYPEQTATFLKNQPDQFANPVGNVLREGLNGLCEAVLTDEISEETEKFLDNIIRIRAVQDFSASGAVSFIFVLKRVVGESLSKELKAGAVNAGELIEILSRVDSIALMGFDVFMKCREKLYDIKANEARSMTYRLLQRANLITDLGEEAAVETTGTVTVLLNAIKEKG